MEPEPGSKVDEGSYAHPDELDGHGGLAELVVGSVDEAVESRQREVVECPVEAEDGMEDDADQSAELVPGVSANEGHCLLVLDHELAEPHELACPLKVNCVWE